MCESRLWLSAVARKPEQVGSGCWIFSSAVRWRCTKWPVAVPCCAGWQTQLRTELCRLDKKCWASGNQEFRHQRISILTVESGPASLLPLANNVEYINCMQACVCPSMTPKNAPSHWGSGTTPNTWFLEPSLVHTQNQGCSAAGTRLNAVPANILEPQRRSANIVGHRWNANTEVFRQITLYSLGWPSMSLFSVPNCPQMRIWHQKSPKKFRGWYPRTPHREGTPSRTHPQHGYTPCVGVQAPPLLGPRSRKPFPQIKIYHYIPAQNGTSVHPFFLAYQCVRQTQTDQNILVTVGPYLMLCIAMQWVQQQWWRQRFYCMYCSFN